MSGSTLLRRPSSTTFRARTNSISKIAVGAVLPALAGALLLAGCGGGGGSTAAAASGTATAADQSAFQSCLRQHGVTIAARPSGQFTGRPSGRPTGAFPTGSFPSGGFPGGTPRPGRSFGGANSSAFQACAKYAPSGAARGPGGAGISSSALAAFKSCMTSHGVKVTGSTAGAILAQIRTSTGKTATAFRTCQVLIQPAAPTPTPSA